MTITLREQFPIQQRIGVQSSRIVKRLKLSSSVPIAASREALISIMQSAQVDPDDPTTISGASFTLLAAHPNYPNLFLQDIFTECIRNNPYEFLFAIEYRTPASQAFGGIPFTGVGLWTGGATERIVQFPIFRQVTTTNPTSWVTITPWYQLRKKQKNVVITSLVSTASIDQAVRTAFFNEIGHMFKLNTWFLPTETFLKTNATMDEATLSSAGQTIRREYYIGEQDTPGFTPPPAEDGSTHKAVPAIPALADIVAGFSGTNGAPSYTIIPRSAQFGPDPA